ncbi:MAG TPA: hypothetical protein DCS42_12300 [Nitrospiraceae bacterium]|nr:hypothetical protein [Nitrospiraceae bacterium]HAS54832.1 hypothetical protein [Nitrospiraceae bacterium]
MSLPVTFEQNVKERIKAIVGELVHEEVWEKVVRETIASFLRDDLPKLVKSELTEKYKSLISAELAKPEWKQIPWDHDTLTEWHPLPTEIPNSRQIECKSCDGTGKVITCEDCAGDGEVEYTYESLSGKTYDADLECPVCEGRGKINGNGERCEVCEGQGFTIENVPVKVLAIGLSISNHLLRRVRDLPGIMISVKGRVDDLPPVRFRFDGGDGLIMPMRDKVAFA